MKARSGCHDNDRWGSRRSSRCGSREALNNLGFSSLNGCKFYVIHAFVFLFSRGIEGFGFFCTFTCVFYVQLFCNVCVLIYNHLQQVCVCFRVAPFPENIICVSDHSARGEPFFCICPNVKETQSSLEGFHLYGGPGMPRDPLRRASRKKG